MTTKRCTICGEDKPISSFNKQKQGKHGVNSWCRPCFKVYNIEYRAKNVDRERERSRKWAENNKPIIIARIKADRVKRPEHFREYGRLRRVRNPDQAAEYDARKSAKRRAWLSADDADFTAREWKDLKEKHGHRCAYCGSSGPLQRDHVVPVSRGGRHTKENILPACGPCNNSKNNKTLDEWMLGARRVRN